VILRSSVKILGAELYEETEIKDKTQVVDFMNDRVARYREILMERYL